MTKTTKLSAGAASLMAELEATAQPNTVRPWTEEEREFLRVAKGKGYTARAIAKILKRGQASVDNKWSAMK
jgi:ParB-like chromosome segregation protein Spo0J